MEKTVPITGIIHTKNAAIDIQEAIQSLDFCSEILVADMESQDETTTIAQAAGATVISVADHQYADPVRQQILEKARQPWIFVLDADERISEKLASAIPKLILEDGIDAYAIPRRNILFGRWLQHTGWWPDTQVRLLKKGVLEWPSAVHSQPIVHGVLQHLAIDPEICIEHYNYRSITDFIDRMNRYTTLEVDKKSFTQPESVLAQSVREYCQRVIAQNGWRDGRTGITAAYLQSIYTGVATVKTWEKTRSNVQEPVQTKLFVKSLDDARKELAYWSAQYKLVHAHGINKLWLRIRRKWQF